MLMRVGTIILLSGPVGAGKTTVARELVALWPDPVAHIEGDVFWSFLAKPSGPRARNFPVIMRAMTAAAVPLARSGYDVLLDFSMPPEFCDTARKIARELPLALVVIKPAERVCADQLPAAPRARFRTTLSTTTSTRCSPPPGVTRLTTTRPRPRNSPAASATDTSPAVSRSATAAHSSPL